MPRRTEPAEQRPAAGLLQKGVAYEHVYFVFLDASGHSTVVRSNARDRAAEAFNLFEGRVRERFERVGNSRRCNYVDSWGWQGDGGLFIVWDEDESKSNATAIETAQAIVELDVPHLRDEFPGMGLRGELHVRVSVHRGALTYLGDDLRGSIHSPDLNFAAHLEKACPADCVAISRDVYDAAASENRDRFRAVGHFEGREILVCAPAATEQAKRLWIDVHGVGTPNRIAALSQRPSQAEKAEFLRVASESVIDLGTALRTCANYLVTTERPRPYRDAVTELLERGIRYRCFVLRGNDSDPPVNPIDPSEDLGTKVTEALSKLERYKKTLAGSVADRFEVYSTPHYPGFASLALDLHADSGSILYSPYLPTPPQSGEALERGDMPHYFVTPSAGDLFLLVAQQTLAFTEADGVERIL